MIEGIIETLLSQLRQLFFSGASTALEMVLDALQQLPTPSLSEDFFRSPYAIVWGFAVLLSFLTGLVGMLMGLTSRQRGLTPAQSLLYFLRVYVQAIILPIGVAFGILLSDLMVTAALSMPATTTGTELFVDLPGMAGVADELLATVLAFLNWLFGWALAIWVLLLTWGVLPLMLIAVALSPLAPLGKDPGGFMRRSYNWIAVAISAKVVVAVVLMVGMIFVGLLSNLGIALVDQLFQLATLIAAIWMSFGLRSKFADKDVMAVWMPAPITAKVTGGQQTAHVNLQAARTGYTNARHDYHGHQASPARIRRALHTGLSTTAAAAPDPRVRKVATIGAWLAKSSTDKAEAKAKEGADNDRL